MIEITSLDLSFSVLFSFSFFLSHSVYLIYFPRTWLSVSLLNETLIPISPRWENKEVAQQDRLGKFSSWKTKEDWSRRTTGLSQT